MYLEGVCYQFCVDFESNGCPITEASPWSRWGSWCSEYTPNKELYPEAKPLEEAFKEKEE
jgi:hypothetical protein